MNIAKAFHFISWLLSSPTERRQKLRSTPFPTEWRGILHRRFPLLACLPPADQRELEGHIQVFLAEKQFEGCDGLVITDEIRVVIAAQACLLLLHRDTDYYPDLQSILVYPSTYFSRVTEEDEKDSRGFAGQSWQRGPLILAWDAVQGGVSDRSDGHNVVFHEFAHRLDNEDDRIDGAPVLEPNGAPLERLSRYRSWARILSKEYEQLQRASMEGQPSVLDEYGATDPAEFFAVATECFFEKPRQLRQKHRQLYDELKGFYQQDPAEWCLQALSTPPGSGQ
ncbi:MAG: zinc-dependent peptidase [Verrucomicrobia bacterium]|nr:zinc-dependent peptidase [Verrucomicrobiota bacterium]